MLSGFQSNGYQGNSYQIESSSAVTLDTHDGATADAIRKYRDKLKILANARSEFESLIQHKKSVNIKIDSTDKISYTDNYTLELLLLMAVQ